jgi:hypothetical protein
VVGVASDAQLNKVSPRDMSSSMGGSMDPTNMVLAVAAVDRWSTMSVVMGFGGGGSSVTWLSTSLRTWASMSQFSWASWRCQLLLSSTSWRAHISTTFNVTSACRVLGRSSPVGSI